MLGMEISHREGQSVYMRAYEDFYQYTLKITERDQPGLEEITWRAKSAEALSHCRYLRSQGWEVAGRKKIMHTDPLSNSPCRMVTNERAVGTRLFHCAGGTAL
jgi:hypothetical protein